MLARDVVTRIVIALDDRSAFGIGTQSAADPFLARAFYALEPKTR
jgi:hypothetical protein